MLAMVQRRLRERAERYEAADERDNREEGE
jgi:hypothetical protein